MFMRHAASLLVAGWRTCGVYALGHLEQPSTFGEQIARPLVSDEEHPRKQALLGTQSPFSNSEREASSASAIRLSVGSVEACQPRSISPRYLASIFGILRATASSVSSRASRASRIASPTRRDSGSARVRLGKVLRGWAAHGPVSLRRRRAVEHSTCSPFRGLVLAYGTQMRVANLLRACAPADSRAHDDTVRTVSVGCAGADDCQQTGSPVTPSLAGGRADSCLQQPNVSRSRIALAICTVLLAVLAVTPATALAAEACPNQAIREQQDATHLPNCRAYELVSPTGPYSAEFNALSPDGRTVFFASGGPVGGLPPAINTGNSAVRMFGTTRQANGWGLTLSTNFSDELAHKYPFVGSTADDAQMFVISEALESEAIPGAFVTQAFSTNLYVAGNDVSPILISHAAEGNPLSGGESQGLTGPAIVSADGSNVVFSSGTPLTAVAAASGGGPYIYEADAAGNVSLVSVMSDGELPPPEGGAALGGSAIGDHNDNKAIVTNAVSADGSTVFFSSTEQYDPSAPAGLGRQVFMHRDGATIDVSRGIENASFDAASTDGSKVVFSDENHNIYEFDSSTDMLSTIASGGTPNPDTYLGMSADGSHVYFTSDLRRDPSAPPFTGEPFLYEWVEGHIKYIATLGEDDIERLTSVTAPASSKSGNEGSEGQSDETGTGALGPIRATADGAYLVFESERPLTPDDHNEEPHRTNVYEYTEGQGLSRVSAGSLASSGNGPYSATIGSQQQFPDFAADSAGEHPPFTFGPEQTDGGVVTEDGAVFFSSREALAPGAVNGPLHVYEWSQGETTLISAPGAEAADAHYLDSSTNGENVYFATSQAMLPSDTNGGWVSIWDARTDGGFSGAPPNDPCAANECAVPSPVPRGTPSSMAFSGPDNANVSIAPAPLPASAQSPTVTRAQKRAKALKVCRKDKSKAKRAKCEAGARKKYGAKPKPKAKSRKGGK
jgi:hypothetical protein